MDRNKNRQRQAYMRALGYRNIPLDGSWGPYQQKIWDKLTTREKLYDATFVGFLTGLKDKLTGNNTYKVDPTNPGEITQYDPKKVDWGKTRRSLSKVVNALSGTWLPGAAVVATPALASAVVSAPIATATSVVGGTVGGKVVNEASKAVTGKDFATNVAEHTPLSPDLAEILNPGTWLGGFLGGRVKSPIDNRVAELNTKYSNQIDYASLHNKGWNWDGGLGTFHTPKTAIHATVKKGGDKIDTYTGGVHVVPARNFTNPELHFNTNDVYVNGRLSDRFPVSNKSILEAKQVINAADKGVPLSQNGDAKPIGLALLYFPFMLKLKYVLTGKNPLTMNNVKGYSTDIYPTMRNYANKGYGHFEKSATTRVSGTNVYGKSYDKLKSYFGNPNKNGELSFKDMTSDQVSKWNSEMADQYGMHIDPITRTAEQYIFVTGEKPQQSIFWRNLASPLFNYINQ